VKFHVCSAQTVATVGKFGSRLLQPKLNALRLGMPEVDEPHLSASQ
jgi:hypothetical protein